MKSEQYVLVHGMCHGAWCWYKLKPLLECLGHKVTALDMGASRINTKPLEEIHTFDDYSQPLISFMASLSDDEKVVLVGHSLGGLNIAFAMGEFPDKILAAVFVSAFIPDTQHSPSFFIDKLFSNPNPWMDSQFSTYGSPEEPVLSHGVDLTDSVFNNPQDYELAKMLVRSLTVFNNTLVRADKFFDARYGSVRRIYVIFKEDKGMMGEFVWEMLEGNGVKEVKVIEGADHMGMLSKPQQLSDCLVQILSVGNP